MIKVLLSENSGNGYKWFSAGQIFVKGYLFTKERALYKDEGLLDYFAQTERKEDFIEKICTATGLFSVLIHDEKQLWAATDGVRAFPLFYTQNGDNFYISDTPGLLLDEIPGSSFNERTALQFKAIGYVLSRDTLLNNVFQVQAGEAVFYDEMGLFRCFYTEDPFRLPVSVKSRNQLKIEFSRVLSLLSKRLITLLDGRPVALPLSGGYDSRLLACLLKKEGYENVTCFTYGAPDTPEKENARKTAEALGYKWIFIDYSDYMGEDVAASEQFGEWVEFTSRYSSFPYFQEYLAARSLKEKKLISDDTVIIPGHSADFNAGSHLTRKKERLYGLPNLVRYASLKNVNLIRLKKEERKTLDEAIAQTMLDYNCEPADFKWYERWQIKERQTKQIVNSSKIWDFFGYQYVLPFWDELFVTFFAVLPFSFKTGKNFYNEAVNELFAEEGVSFGHNLKSPWFVLQKQQVKLWLTRFSLLRPLLDRNILWKTDFSCYRHFTQNMVAVLKDSGSYNRILRFNGVLSAWYLLHIKGK